MSFNENLPYIIYNKETTFGTTMTNVTSITYQGNGV